MRVLSASKSAKRAAKDRIAVEWNAPGLKQYARRQVDGYRERLALVAAQGGRNRFRGWIWWILIGHHAWYTLTRFGKKWSFIFALELTFRRREYRISRWSTTPPQLIYTVWSHHSCQRTSNPTSGSVRLRSDWPDNLGVNTWLLSSTLNNEIRHKVTSSRPLKVDDPIDITTWFI